MAQKRRGGEEWGPAGPLVGVCETPTESHASKPALAASGICRFTPSSFSIYHLGFDEGLLLRQGAEALAARAVTDASAAL